MRFARTCSESRRCHRWFCCSESFGGQLLIFFKSRILSNPSVYLQQARAACGLRKTAVPLLRAYNARATDHLYTTNAAEMQNAVTRLGYTREGTTGHIFPTAELHTVPLYRLYNAAIEDHIYTTSAEERDNAIKHLGYTNEGIAGYVYPDTACGGQPLYRLSHSGAATDHLYTMSADERDNASEHMGYTQEGIAG